MVGPTSIHNLSHDTSGPETPTMLAGSATPDSDEAGLHESLTGTLMANSQDPFLATSGVINGAASDTSMRCWYWTCQDNKTASFVFPNCQQTLWQCLQDQEETGRPDASWGSKEEWGLVYWLIMAQLSQVDINTFLKLPWAH